MDPEAACDLIAAGQHGVITRAQALGAGLSRSAVDRRVAAGRWRTLRPGVYAPRSVPPSWHQRLTAAVLAGGPSACASHRSAGALWSLDGVGERLLEISLPTGRRMSGVSVHRSRRDDDRDITHIDGIRVTAIERTILDLSGVVSPRGTALALDDALRRRLTSPARVAEVLERRGSRGRPGMAALRELLARRGDGDGLVESRLESALLEVLRHHDVPLPVAQHEIVEGSTVVARVDFAYPAVRLGIEADGYRWHGGRERWANDIRRENRLKLLGWTLLRFT
ncbi:MAG: type IV toxin-antitoxin system AbiEi family antitoxin domain-containing protein, partial [Actinomycetota bacterium]